MRSDTKTDDMIQNSVTYDSSVTSGCVRHGIIRPGSSLGLFLWAYSECNSKTRIISSQMLAAGRLPNGVDAGEYPRRNIMRCGKLGRDLRSLGSTNGIALRQRRMPNGRAGTPKVAAHRRRRGEAAQS